MIAGRKQILIWSALSLATGYAAPAFAQPTWITIEGVADFPGDANPATYSYPAPLDCPNLLVWGQQYDTWPPEPLTITSSNGPVIIPADRRWILRLHSKWADGCDLSGWRDYLTIEPLMPNPNLFGGWMPSAEWALSAADPTHTAEPHWPVTQDQPTWSSPPPGQYTYDVLGLATTGPLFVPGATFATVTMDVTYATVLVRVDIGTPPAATDLDGNGVVGVPDVMAFLSAWMAGVEPADWDASGVVAVPDLFAFLTAWFEGQR